jgi:hypothetical protein
MLFTATTELILTAILFVKSLSGQNIDPQPAWKKYPYSIGPDYPEMMFPAAEANHISDESDTWFVTGKLTGQSMGKNDQFLTIFDKNKIGTLTFNFYQVSLFELDIGDYSTFTDYDVVVVGNVDAKLNYSDVKLDLSQGMAIWH